MTEQWPSSSQRTCTWLTRRSIWTRGPRSSVRRQMPTPLPTPRVAHPTIPFCCECRIVRMWPSCTGLPMSKLSRHCCAGLPMSRLVEAASSPVQPDLGLNGQSDPQMDYPPPSGAGRGGEGDCKNAAQLPPVIVFSVGGYMGCFFAVLLPPPSCTGRGG